MDEQRDKLMSAREVLPAATSEERDAVVLSEEEEAFLSGVTTSGQFSLNNVATMYAGVVRIRRGEESKPE